VFLLFFFSSGKLAAQACTTAQLNPNFNPGAYGPPCQKLVENTFNDHGILQIDLFDDITNTVIASIVPPNACLPGTAGGGLGGGLQPPCDATCQGFSAVIRPDCGDDVSIQITAGTFVAANAVDRAIWLDSDQDGTFDITELVSSAPNSSGATLALDLDYNALGLVPGQCYLMRAMSVDNNAGGTVNNFTDPCLTSDAGAVTGSSVDFWICLSLEPDIEVTLPSGPYCVDDPIVPLLGLFDNLPSITAIDDGVWSGPGVTEGPDPSPAGLFAQQYFGYGTFDPGAAGVGTHELLFTYTGTCSVAQIPSVTTVYPSFDPTFDLPPAICQTDGAIALVADDVAAATAFANSSPLGDGVTPADIITWQVQPGNGVTDNGTGGTFDPTLLADGSYTVCLEIGINSCSNTYCQSILVGCGSDACDTCPGPDGCEVLTYDAPTVFNDGGTPATLVADGACQDVDETTVTNGSGNTFTYCGTFVATSEEVGLGMLATPTTIIPDDPATCDVQMTITLEQIEGNICVNPIPNTDGLVFPVSVTGPASVFTVLNRNVIMYSDLVIGEPYSYCMDMQVVGGDATCALTDACPFVQTCLGAGTTGLNMETEEEAGYICSASDAIGPSNFEIFSNEDYFPANAEIQYVLYNAAGPSTGDDFVNDPNALALIPLSATTGTPTYTYTEPNTGPSVTYPAIAGGVISDPTDGNVADDFTYSFCTEYVIAPVVNWNGNVVDLNGCVQDVNTEQTHNFVFQPPIGIALNSETCNGDGTLTVVYDITGGRSECDGSQMFYTITAGNTTSTGTVAHGSQVEVVGVSGAYQLIIEDNSGCIQVNGGSWVPPSAQLELEFDELCAGQDMILPASVDANGTATPLGPDGNQFGAFAGPLLGELQVTIGYDNFPVETSWQIRNGAGTVVGTGNGGAAAPFAVDVFNVLVDPNDTYTFEIFDSFNDGNSSCAPGSGSFDVVDLGTGASVLDETADNAGTPFNLGGGPVTDWNSGTAALGQGGPGTCGSSAGNDGNATGSANDSGNWAFTSIAVVASAAPIGTYTTDAPAAALVDNADNTGAFLSEQAGAGQWTITYCGPDFATDPNYTGTPYAGCLQQCVDRQVVVHPKVDACVFAAQTVCILTDVGSGAGVVPLSDTTNPPFFNFGAATTAYPATEYDFPDDFEIFGYWSGVGVTTGADTNVDGTAGDDGGPVNTATDFNGTFDANLAMAQLGLTVFDLPADISVSYTVGHPACQNTCTRTFRIVANVDASVNDLTVCASPSGNYPLSAAIAGGTCVGTVPATFSACGNGICEQGGAGPAGCADADDLTAGFESNTIANYNCADCPPPPSTDGGAVASPYSWLDPCYQTVIGNDGFCSGINWDGICQGAYDGCNGGPVPPPNATMVNAAAPAPEVQTLTQILAQSPDPGSTFNLVALNAGGPANLVADIIVYDPLTATFPIDMDIQYCVGQAGQGPDCFDCQTFNIIVEDCTVPVCNITGISTLCTSDPDFRAYDEASLTTSTDTIPGAPIAMPVLGIDASDATGAGDWDRPSAGCVGGGAADHPHGTFAFSVDTDGAYTITATHGGFDGFLHIYEAPFDATLPGTNCLAGDDDGPGGLGDSQVVGVALTACTDYVAVISTFSGFSGGGLSDLDITGPGAAISPCTFDGYMPGTFTLFEITDNTTSPVTTAPAPAGSFTDNGDGSVDIDPGSFTNSGQFAMIYENADGDTCALEIFSVFESFDPSFDVPAAICINESSSGCGDGVLDAGENVFNCTADAGPGTPPNACCAFAVDGVTPLWQEDPCWQDVTAADAFCLNNAWDGVCEGAYNTPNASGNCPGSFPQPANTLPAAMGGLPVNLVANNPPTPADFPPIFSPSGAAAFADYVRWSGPFVTDNGDGTAIFDPDTTGVFTIVYVVGYDQCETTYAQTIDIVDCFECTLDLIGTQNEVCQQDAAFTVYDNALFDGDFDATTYTFGAFTVHQITDNTTVPPTVGTDTLTAMFTDNNNGTLLIDPSQAAPGEYLITYCTGSDGVFSGDGICDAAGGEDVFTSTTDCGAPTAAPACCAFAVDGVTPLWLEDPCYAEVVANDGFCNTTAWDGICEGAYNGASANCPGTFPQPADTFPPPPGGGGAAAPCPTDAGGVTSFDGDNSPGVAEGTWDRSIGACGGGISGLGPVNYVTFEFTVPAGCGGTYDFQSVQNYDGYMHIYDSPFDPLNQATNCLAVDDDGAGGIGTSDILGLNLTAGNTYVLVISAFAAADFGTSTTTITPVGAAGGCVMECSGGSTTVEELCCAYDIFVVENCCIDPVALATYSAQCAIEAINIENVCGNGVVDPGETVFTCTSDAGAPTPAPACCAAGSGGPLWLEDPVYAATVAADGFCNTVAWDGICDGAYLGAGGTFPQPQDTFIGSDCTTIDASLAFSTAGGIDTYLFDLDGDGDFETNNGNNPIICHQFDDCGAFDVGVLVQDACGTDTTSLCIFIPCAPEVILPELACICPGDQVTIGAYFETDSLFCESFDPADLAGSTAGAPTFNRLFACGATSGFANNVAFVEQSFTVSESGNYTITSTQDYDGYIHLFEAPFDAANPTVGTCLGVDDDGPGGIGTSELVGMALTACTEYVLVTTGFGNGDSGNFTTAITGGPGMAIANCGGTTDPVCSAAQTDTDTTTPDGTYNRMFGDCTGVSGVGTNVAYSVIPFSVDETGSYTISSTQAYDGFMTIYEGAFDPLDPAANCLGSNDDGPGGIGTSEVTATLNVGTTYFIVIAGFGNGDSGTATNTITGPGSAYCGTEPFQPQVINLYKENWHAEWIFGGDFEPVVGSPDSITITETTPGTYTAIFQIMDHNTWCTFQYPVSITICDTPTVAIQGLPEFYCQGDAIPQAGEVFNLTGVPTPPVDPDCNIDMDGRNISEADGTFDAFDPVAADFYSNLGNGDVAMDVYCFTAGYTDNYSYLFEPTFDGTIIAYSPFDINDLSANIVNFTNVAAAGSGGLAIAATAGQEYCFVVQGQAAGDEGDYDLEIDVPEQLSTFTLAPACAGCLVDNGDGTATFDPNAAGVVPGTTYTITYNFMACEGGNCNSTPAMETIFVDNVSGDWDGGAICCTADPVFLGFVDGTATPAAAPAGTILLTDPTVNGTYPTTLGGDWTGINVSVVNPDASAIDNGDEYFIFDPSGLIEGEYTLTYAVGGVCGGIFSNEMFVYCEAFADLGSWVACKSISAQFDLTQLFIDDFSIGESAAGAGDGNNTTPGGVFSEFGALPGGVLGITGDILYYDFNAITATTIVPVTYTVGTPLDTNGDGVVDANDDQSDNDCYATFTTFVTIQPTPDPEFDLPDFICTDDESLVFINGVMVLPLNQFVNQTDPLVGVGVFTGTGVFEFPAASGMYYFNPDGLDGGYTNITYEITIDNDPEPDCIYNEVAVIEVVLGGDPAWNAPREWCANDYVNGVDLDLSEMVFAAGSYTTAQEIADSSGFFYAEYPEGGVLNAAIYTTAPGQYFFNPSGNDGTLGTYDDVTGWVEITFCVGVEECIECETHEILVHPVVTAEINDAEYCQNGSNIDLSNLVEAGSTQDGVFFVDGTPIFGDDLDIEAINTFVDGIASIEICYAVGPDPVHYNGATYPMNINNFDFTAENITNDEAGANGVDPGAGPFTNCNVLVCETITVYQDLDPFWQSPGNVCANGGLVPLNTPPTGFTATGTANDPLHIHWWDTNGDAAAIAALSDANAESPTFDPLLLNGYYALTYCEAWLNMAADTICTECHTSEIFVFFDVNPALMDTTVCETLGTINLTDLFINGTTTPGGTFSSTDPTAEINGNILTVNGQGCAGVTAPAIPITYTVGDVANGTVNNCEESMTVNVTVLPDVDATFTVPEFFCEDDLTPAASTYTMIPNHEIDATTPACITGADDLWELFYVSPLDGSLIPIGGLTDGGAADFQAEFDPAAAAAAAAVWAAGNGYPFSIYPASFEIMYTVGLSGATGRPDCQESYSQRFTVLEELVATLKMGIDICYSTTPVDLTQFLTDTTTPGGTWTLLPLGDNDGGASPFVTTYDPAVYGPYEANEGINDGETFVAPFSEIGECYAIKYTVEDPNGFCQPDSAYVQICITPTPGTTYSGPNFLCAVNQVGFPLMELDNIVNLSDYVTSDPNTSILIVDITWEVIAPAAYAGVIYSGPPIADIPWDVSDYMGLVTLQYTEVAQLDPANPASLTCETSFEEVIEISPNVDPTFQCDTLCFPDVNWPLTLTPDFLIMDSIPTLNYPTSGVSGVCTNEFINYLENIVEWSLVEAVDWMGNPIAMADTTVINVTDCGDPNNTQTALFNPSGPGIYTVMLEMGKEDCKETYMCDFVIYEEVIADVIEPEYVEICEGEILYLNEWLSDDTTPGGIWTVDSADPNSLLAAAIANLYVQEGPIDPTTLQTILEWYFNSTGLGGGTFDLIYTVGMGDPGSSCFAQDTLEVYVIPLANTCWDLEPSPIMCEDVGPWQGTVDVNGNDHEILGGYILQDMVGGPGCIEDPCIDTIDIELFGPLNVGPGNTGFFNGVGTHTLSASLAGIPFGADILGFEIQYNYFAINGNSEGDIDESYLIIPGFTGGINGSDTVVYIAPEFGFPGPGGDGDEHFEWQTLTYNDIPDSLFANCTPPDITWTVTSNAENWGMGLRVNVIYNTCIFWAQLHEEDGGTLIEYPVSLPYDDNGDGDYDDVNDIPGGVYYTGNGNWVFDANGLEVFNEVEIIFDRLDCDACSNPNSQFVFVVESIDPSLKKTADTICIADGMIDLTQYLAETSTNGGQFYGPGAMGDIFDPEMVGPGSHTICYELNDGVPTCGGGSDCITIWVEEFHSAAWVPALPYWCEGDIVTLSPSQPTGTGTWSSTNADVQAMLDANTVAGSNNNFFNSSNLSDASSIEITYTVVSEFGTCVDSETHHINIVSSFNVNLTETLVEACDGDLNCLDLSQYFTNDSDGTGQGYWQYTSGPDATTLSGFQFCPAEGTHVLTYIIEASGDCGSSDQITFVIGEAAAECFDFTDYDQYPVVCEGEGLIGLNDFLCDEGLIKTFDATICRSDVVGDMQPVGDQLLEIPITGIPEGSTITEITFTIDYVANGSSNSDGDSDTIGLTIGNTVIAAFGNAENPTADNDNHFGAFTYTFDESTGFAPMDLLDIINTDCVNDTVRYYLYSNSEFWDMCVSVHVEYLDGYFSSTIHESGVEIPNAGIGVNGGVVYLGEGQYAFDPTGLCEINDINIAFTRLTCNYCDTYQEFPVEVVCSVDATLGNDSTICYQPFLDITGFFAEGTTSGGTFSGNGMFGSLLQPDVNGGTYTITYTVGSPTSACGMDSDDITVTVLPALSAAFDAPGAFCSFPSTQNLTNFLLPGTAADGTWAIVSGGGSISGNTYSLDGYVGYVTISYTVSNGECDYTHEEVVQVGIDADASFSAPSTMCVGETLDLEANAVMAGFEWAGMDVNGTMFEPSEPGTYIITHTVGNTLCFKSFSKAVVVYGIPEAPQVSEGNSVCLDGTLATIDIAGPFDSQFTVYDADGIPIQASGNYSIDTFDPNPFVDTSVPGTHTFTITQTNQGGCEGPAASVSYTVWEEPTIAESGVSFDCTSQEGNATMTVIPTGGLAPYSISIDGGATYADYGVAQFAVLAGVINDIVVMDSNGCISSTTVSAAADMPVEFSAFVSCPDGNNLVTVSVTANGGSGLGYTVSFNGGGFTDQFEQSYSSETLTEVTVQVMDGNGCTSDVDVFSLVEVKPFEPVVSCVDENGLVRVQVYYIGPDNYTVLADGVATTNPFWVNPDDVDQVTISLETDGCESTSVVVDIYDEVGAAITNVACLDPETGLTDLTISAGGGDGNYWLSVNNGPNQPLGDGILSLAPGYYVFSLEDSRGCAADDFAYFVSDAAVPQPFLATNSVTEACNAADLVLNVLGGVNYMWTDAEGNVVATGDSYVPVFDGSSATFYVSSEFQGCDSAPLAVNVSLYPEIGVENLTENCDNGDASITFDMTGDSEFLVDGLLVSGSSVTLDITSGVDYMVVITGANTGCTTSFTGNFECSADLLAVDDEYLDNTAGSDVVIDMTDNDIGEGYTLSIDGPPSQGTLTDLGNGMWLYSPNDPDVEMDFVTYTITSADGSSSSTATVTITFVAPTDFTATPAVVCNDDEFNVVVTIIGEPGTTIGYSLDGVTYTDVTTDENGVGIFEFSGTLDANSEGSYTFYVQDPATGNVEETTNSVACTVTAIELLTFDGRVETEGNQLYWTTATEIDNDFFTLERSLDGVNFQPIADIDGAGTSSVELDYAYMDTDAPIGRAYYRLGETDFNGNYQIASNVVELIRTTSSTDLTVWPVPAITEAIISWNQTTADKATISVYAADGKLVIANVTEVEAGKIEYLMDVQMLPAGMYMLQVTTSDKVMNTKLLID